MSNNATGNVFASIREATIKLEGLEKNGETESSSARLCAKKFKFALGKRPVQSEFLRVPVLLHGPPFGGFDPSTKSKLAAGRVHDQGAAAKLVEKEQSGMPWFRRFRLLCRNFDLRYLRANKVPEMDKVTHRKLERFVENYYHIKSLTIPGASPQAFQYWHIAFRSPDGNGRERRRVVSVWSPLTAMVTVYRFRLDGTTWTLVIEDAADKEKLEKNLLVG